MTTWLGSQDQGWKVGYVSSKLGDLIYAGAWYQGMDGFFDGCQLLSGVHGRVGGLL